MRARDIKFGALGAALGDRDTYLREAMWGEYRYGSENRLSQIFSASFNQSEVFRKAVGDFFGCMTLRQAVSRTEEGHNTKFGPARLDIVVRTRRGRPLLIIENKVKAKFGVDQPRKYCSVDELKRCRKYCLLKHYKAQSDVHHAWELRYWGGFYLHLLKQQRKQSKEDFFAENFLATLRDYEMDNPTTIKRADLKRLAKAMNEIRYSEKPDLSLNEPTFEVMVDLKKMLADLFRKAVTTKNLRNRAGKSFRPKMRTSYWWDDDPKMRMLWVGCDTDLKKAYKGITGFGAALILYGERHREKYDLIAYVIESNGYWRSDIKCYGRTDVDCSEFCDMAIKYWDRVLR
jgi:PD-(D/E)XK nuclease superfamily